VFGFLSWLPAPQRVTKAAVIRRRDSRVTDFASSSAIADL
jgi:hypothetical protein